MPENTFSDIIFRAPEIPEEFRIKGIRRILEVFQDTLIYSPHKNLPLPVHREQKIGNSVGEIMSGGLEALETALQSCGTEHAIRHVVDSYVQIAKKMKNKNLNTQEGLVLQLKIRCIVFIGIMLQGGIPEENSPEYAMLRQLLIASISATSVFQRGIEIPQLRITLKI